MVVSIRYFAIAAAVVASAKASGTSPWSPVTTPAKYQPGCEPWEEEYLCDDDDGKGEHMSTYTMFSKGCPGYTEWNIPTVKAKDTWAAYTTTKNNMPMPTGPGGKGPKPSWDGKGPKPSGWDDYDGPDSMGPKPTGPKPSGPKPTWDGKGPKPSGWDDYEGPGPMGPKPTGPKPSWDGKGPKPSGWDDMEGPGPMGPKPTGPKPTGPKPTWDGKGPKPSGYDDWEAYYGPGPMGPKPTGPKPSWDGKGPKPSGYDDWEAYYGPGPMGPKPTGMKPSWDGKGPKPTGWDDYYGKPDFKTVVVITLTETYTVPCETGWSTTKKVWYTTHCGCTETPYPSKPPMSTYTTTCPESWGIGKTVTVIVPAPTWTPEAETIKVASTWSVYESVKSVDASSTWVTWVAPTTTSVYPAGATWSTYASPVKGATTTTGAWSPIATYKGAASSSTVSKAMVVVGGAVAGLAFFL